MQYWDTSTLAKLYVNEPDSAQFAAYLATTGPITTSELTRWELFRVLARKEAGGLLPSGASEVIFGRFLADVTAGKVGLVPMNPLLETRFQQLVLRLHRLNPPLGVRTLDGTPSRGCRFARRGLARRHRHEHAQMCRRNRSEALPLRGTLYHESHTQLAQAIRRVRLVA
jgi:hypothetical protein